MASYIGMGGSISPSRRLTDFLSAYLDFDDGPSSPPSASSATPSPPPSSADAPFDASTNTAGAADNNTGGSKRRARSLLNLGLWGGDLSLRNVSLKSEAVEPLLNGLLPPPPRGGKKRPRPPSSAPNVDANLEGDLQLTLIRGTIGHLRLAVPWRQLVLGGGYDAKEQAKGRGQPVVEVVVEDVTVVLGLRSSSGGGGGGKGGPNVDTNTEGGKSSDNNSDDEEEKEEERHDRRRRVREERQRRLAESERLHLRGLTIPDGEDHVAWGRDEEGRPLRLSSTAGIGDDASGGGGAAAAVSSAAKGDDASEQPQPSSTTGMIHRLLQTAASSLVWRLVTHLKARVRNLRVVIVVDGVEVGLTVDSHDVEYWSEEESTSGVGEGGEGRATTRGSTPPAVPSVVIRGPPGRIVRRRVPPANDASTAPLTVEDSATELPPLVGSGGEHHGRPSTSSGTTFASHRSASGLDDGAMATLWASMAPTKWTIVWRMSKTDCPLEGT